MIELSAHSNPALFANFDSDLKGQPLAFTIDWNANAGQTKNQP
jgi:hypothetical protein